jgi:hypothetical protein
VSDNIGTLQTQSLSQNVSAATFPSLPGLRFPSGAILGQHLVVFGTHLSSEAELQGGEFAIWALDLGPGGLAGLQANTQIPLKWKKIETGKTLTGASWNRAIMRGKTVVVLGNQGELKTLRLSKLPLSCLLI